MPPVEKSKGLLVSLRGTPQKQVVSIGGCDPRLPCYGFSACSRCVFFLLPYFPARAQKVPWTAKRQFRSGSKFRFHNSLDARGACSVSAKGNAKREFTSIRREQIQQFGRRSYICEPPGSR